MSQCSVHHAVPGVTGIGDENTCTCHVCYRRFGASLEDLDEGFGSVTGLCILFFFKNCQHLRTVAHSTRSLLMWPSIRTWLGRLTMKDACQMLRA